MVLLVKLRVELSNFKYLISETQSLQAFLSGILQTDLEKMVSAISGFTMQGANDWMDAPHSTGVSITVI